MSFREKSAVFPLTLGRAALFRLPPAFFKAEALYPVPGFQAGAQISFLYNTLYLQDKNFTIAVYVVIAAFPQDMKIQFNMLFYIIF